MVSALNYRRGPIFAKANRYTDRTLLSTAGTIPPPLIRSSILRNVPKSHMWDVLKDLAGLIRVIVYGSMTLDFEAAVTTALQCKGFCPVTNPLGLKVIGGPAADK